MKWHLAIDFYWKPIPIKDQSFYPDQRIKDIKDIREPPGSEKEYEVLVLDNELFKWSVESVAEVLFEKRFGCLEPEVNKEAHHL